MSCEPKLSWRSYDGTLAECEGGVLELRNDDDEGNVLLTREEMDSLCAWWLAIRQLLVAPLQVAIPPLEDWPLSVRAYNFLQKLEIRTAKDLVGCSEEKLRKGKNGNKAVNEIKQEMAKFGLTFATVPTSPETVPTKVPSATQIETIAEKC